MLKPNCPPGELTYQQGYQQALEDFEIAPLFTHLSTYSDADFDATWMNLTQSELDRESRYPWRKSDEKSPSNH